jgi:hypothetical protein
LFVIVTFTPKEIPAEPPCPDIGTLLVWKYPPAPPIPIIKPLLIKATPPGQEPLIVNPALLILVEYTYTPAFIVTTNALLPFQPFANAQVLKLRFVWLEAIVRACEFDLP